MIIDHDALLAKIAEAREAEDATYRAYITASPNDGPARLIDYVRASARRSALTEAGLLITLGLGNGEPRDDR